MALVAYSDSEGSDNEVAAKPITKPTISSQNFQVDKSNPKKILVNLKESSLESSSNVPREDGEPAAKKPRVGNGTFGGFNALLPPPKRDNIPNAAPNGSKKATPRKIFSLRTGPEPAFSRESDAELKDLFAQDNEGRPGNITSASTTQEIPDTIPKSIPSDDDKAITLLQSSTVTAGKPFLFKPLSVARNGKKKKTIAQLGSRPVQPVLNGSKEPVSPRKDTESLSTKRQDLPAAPPKISLFSSRIPETDVTSPSYEIEEQQPADADNDGDEIVETFDNSTLHQPSLPPQTSTFQFISSNSDHDPNSLASIADSLNLSAAERRQLLGRRQDQNFTATRIVNFNTDTEYAANQQLNAMGEQVQHNPVRAIAPGKHSLKALVANAQGQKEALEESFAQGRRNKREAGNKYGW